MSKLGGAVLQTTEPAMKGFVHVEEYPCRMNCFWLQHKALKLDGWWEYMYGKARTPPTGPQPVACVVDGNIDAVLC